MVEKNRKKKDYIKAEGRSIYSPPPPQQPLPTAEQGGGRGRGGGIREDSDHTTGHKQFRKEC